MQVDELTLRPGDPAEVTGTIVRTASGLGVGDSEDMSLIPHGATYPSPTPNVARIRIVALLDDKRALERLVGHRVTAEGIWRAGALRVTEVTLIESDRAADDHAEVVAPPVMGLLPGDAGRIEAPLWKSGAMLWRVAVPTSDDGRRVVVAAHDADLVAHTLRPLYGGDLDVIQSPWDRDAYEQAAAVVALAEAHGVLYGVEKGMGYDGAVRLRVRLTRLTDGVRSVMLGVPDGLLRADVLIRRKRD
jgi:hypothetical protein